jgi:ribosomal-protein-alanine N-acetyltransferase
MKDLSHTRIESDRLYLIPVNESHIQPIFEHYRLPLTQYMNHTSTGPLEELTERHQKWRAEIKAGVRLFAAVHLKATDEFLGCFAIANLDTPTPEMGGWLKLSAHGHHYGQEAAAALKQWTDNHFDYDHILWPCATDNVASCKLAESLGGVLHREYDKEMVSGEVWETREYWVGGV